MNKHETELLKSFDDTFAAFEKELKAKDDLIKLQKEMIDYLKMQLDSYQKMIAEIIGKEDTEEDL